MGRRKAEPEQAPPPREEGLVRVTNGTDTLDIHPTTLVAHGRAGWSLLEG